MTLLIGCISPPIVSAEQPPPGGRIGKSSCVHRADTALAVHVVAVVAGCVDADTVIGSGDAAEYTSDDPGECFYLFAPKLLGQIVDEVCS